MKRKKIKNQRLTSIMVDGDKWNLFRSLLLKQDKTVTTQIDEWVELFLKDHI